MPFSWGTSGSISMSAPVKSQTVKIIGYYRIFVLINVISVYLRTTPEVVHDRMVKRGRSEEAGVPLDYLRQVSNVRSIYYDAVNLYSRTLVNLILLKRKKRLQG